MTADHSLSDVRHEVLAENTAQTVQKHLSKLFQEEARFTRLRRAAVDQLSGDLGALSRYGIWANTVRDNIREAEAAIDDGNRREVRRFLFRAANAMSAFAELQAQFDSAGRESQAEHPSKDD